MNVNDSFVAFANRVVHALRMGKLGEKDTRAVERLLLRTEKRNIIISRAILSTLAGGEQSESDVKRFAALLESADRRAGEGKEPFSAEEKKELEGIFARHSLSAKAARKFAMSVDELLTMELKAQMSKAAVVPKKEEVLPEQKQQEKEKEKLVH